MLNLIYPDWPAPANIKAFSTTRAGGESHGVYHSLNLGNHVGDDIDVVSANRKLLPVPNQPCWLQQVHGIDVIEFQTEVGEPPVADGCYTSSDNQVCAVMTADCLPVLLTDITGSFVAALHCGWKGLADGILEEFMSTKSNPEQVIAWLGPAIGVNAFEVGEDVFAAFRNCPDAFQPAKNGKYYADLLLIARTTLERLGVSAISGCDLCTYASSENFFSYRRDGVTGRMVTCIWKESKFD